ncbi:MAG: ABC transporter substrate-binding protein [Candidatus Devosia euplotis]|nr:ABC transporter substrate-binding protein [Candidatus Devosia euplotis]
MRKGHKWSDGAPFTTADVQFWYDAYFTDADTSLGGNAWRSVNGEPAKLEAMDEQTFKVIFTDPNGFLCRNSPGPSRIS